MLISARFQQETSKETAREQKGDSSLATVQGEISTKRLLARNMLAEGLAPALVVEISGLTEDEVTALAQQ